jgi:hypothetical protein
MFVACLLLLFLLLLLWSLLLLLLLLLASPSRRFGAWRRVSNMKLDLTPRVLLLARQAPLMAIFCFLFCFLCFFLCFPSRQMIHHRHIIFAISVTATATAATTATRDRCPNC